MQSFRCPACDARVYFDNLSCACGTMLCYDPAARRMVTKAPPCANRDAIQCNWTAEPGAALCLSCAMSETVPDLQVADNRRLLAGAERAKRWVLANLSNWEWFTPADPGPRPRFQMLSERTGAPEAEQVTMGHDSGEIVINVTEADELVRVQRQHDLGEQYRSMVGHFRHELAHFLFERLAAAPGFLDAFRALFGDERADYAKALQEHYAHPKDPGENHITPYATAHPHEDWAETVAHLLHLVDYTNSFVGAGLTMVGVPDGYRPYDDPNGDHLLTIAAQVAIAINDINRALDIPDLYPFVLTPPVRAKIAFAHGWIRDQAARGA